MSEWVVYHNDKCSKCRGTLELLEANGVTPKVVCYLDDPPSVEELKQILLKLKKPALEIVRIKEEEFKSVSVDLNDEDAVLQMLTKHPILIERPIVVRGNKAVIGRPPENVLELLK